MDRNKSAKLKGLITKLTNAANKAIRERNEPGRLTKHPKRNHVHQPLRLSTVDGNLRTM